MSPTQLDELLTWDRIRDKPAAYPVAFYAENKEGAAITKGQPCAAHLTKVGVVLAGATKCIGIAAETFANGVAGLVQTEGVMDCSDWTAATGGATLTPGSDYYLSTSSGLLTMIAPTSVGDRVQYVGYALTTTKLDIQIREPILL